MSKFESKSDLKKSLFDNITLMEKAGCKSEWVKFHEIESFLQKGYVIFSDEKRELYEKIQKGSKK